MENPFRNCTCICNAAWNLARVEPHLTKLVTSLVCVSLLLPFISLSIRSFLLFVTVSRKKKRIIMGCWNNGGNWSNCIRKSRNWCFMLKTCMIGQNENSWNSWQNVQIIIYIVEYKCYPFFHISFIFSLYIYFFCLIFYKLYFTCFSIFFDLSFFLNIY